MCVCVRARRERREGERGERGREKREEGEREEKGGREREERESERVIYQCGKLLYPVEMTASNNSVVNLFPYCFI